MVLGKPQLIVFVAGLVGIFFFLVTAFAVTSPMNGVPAPAFAGIGIFGVILASLFIVGIIWLLLDYFLIYVNLKEEHVERAETPALVLGILQLILGGIITGILIIVAYVKIKDSLNRRKYEQGQSSISK